MTRPTPRDQPYDPWLDLATNWPEVAVSVAPLPGDVLGLVRYPLIVLREGSTTAQQRCTLAHEIVHLERGIPHHADASWSSQLAREEVRVERIAGQRLITVARLALAVGELGSRASPAALAGVLEVDRQMLLARLGALTGAERAVLQRAADDDFAAA